MIDLDESKKLIYDTYSKQKIKSNIAVLDKLFNSFSNDTNSLCFVSYDKNQNPISTVFCVMDESTCYYILGGYDLEKKHEGAGALAMWSAIKTAKEKGVTIFDFEGSMLPASRKNILGDLEEI